MIRKYLIGVAFAACTAASFSASAQQQNLGQDQVQSASTYCSTSGLSEPPSDQVWIYSDANFKGACATLYLGFYPNSGWAPGGFGLANDSISSVKIGSAVRARFFRDGVYGGDYFWQPGPYDMSGMPPGYNGAGWNDVVSSIRVEINSRSPGCDDLQPGEYALFRDPGAFREPNWGGDCVVLYYHGNYPEPIYLGIANDSVSAVDGGPRIFCADQPWQPNLVLLNTNGVAEGSGSGTSVMSGIKASVDCSYSTSYCETLPSWINNAISSTGAWCY
jgi:hypothetical protein